MNFNLFKQYAKALQIPFVDPCDTDYVGVVNGTGGSGGSGGTFSCADLASCSLSDLGTANYSDLGGAPTNLSQFTNDLISNTTNAITFNGVTVKQFECTDLGSCSLTDLGTASYNDLADLPTLPADLSDLTDTSNLLFSGAWADITGKPTLTQNGGNVTGSIDLDTGEFALTAPTGGGGAVDSVNGATGVVVLDTSDIADTTDARYMTDAQEAKLDSLIDEEVVPSTDADKLGIEVVKTATATQETFTVGLDINGLAAATLPVDTTNDTVAMYDSSAGRNVKVSLEDLIPKAFAWYDSGVKGIKTYSTGPVTVVENSPGDYDIDGTTEIVDRISYNVFTSGANQNANSGATIFKLSTATGNTSYTDMATPYANGTDSTTGQVKDVNGTLSSGNSFLAVPGGGVITLTLNGFAGAFPDGSKMNIYNLASE